MKKPPVVDDRLELLFRHAGLAEKQAKLYRLLLTTGEERVSTLSRRSGIKRCNVYALLRDLKVRGLVSEFEKGNIELAAEIVGKALDNGYTLSEGDANRAVVVFARVNDFKRLVYVFQQLTALKPANPQYHASLAAAYANVGRIDDSVAEARAAVKADPSFEAEARVFLKQLGREL